jgi:sigma-B regulation protein RsbU (phosphoserine phosphatase)
MKSQHGAASPFHPERDIHIDDDATCSVRILIADDQPDVLAALRLLLKGEGYEIETAPSPAEILKALRSDRFDLLLMDLNYSWDTTSGQEGLNLLKSIRAIDGILPVIAMTGWATLDLALESLRDGVSDFMQKPWDNSRLLSVVRTQIDKGRRLREGQRQQREAAYQMEEAREIQLGLVPRTIPSIPGCDVAVTWRPSGTLSGDYFDVLRFSDHHFGICIADAVGKGVPAALLMSNIQAMVKGLAQDNLPPSQLCEQLNSFVCKTITPNKFITFFYAHLDSERRMLRYANAGHNPPILARRDGTFVRLTTGGAVLGVRSEWRYSQGQIELDSGDRLLLFTDGVSEARDPAGEEFGEGRLIELFLSMPEASPLLLKRKLMQSVTDFCRSPLQDDATLIAISVD